MGRNQMRPWRFPRRGQRLNEDERTMYTMLPVETLSGALELACYVFTMAAALLSCLFNWRG